MASIKENREFWDRDYDWAQEGHEWSVAWGGADMQWFGTILPRLHRYVPTGTILEIAPGFGRWTAYLKDLCTRLLLVDLSRRCIEGCRKRFSSFDHIEYHVNDGYSLEMIPDQAIDLVFSFDSLVHAERDVMEAYVSQISSKLTRDGVAFIHHSNIGKYRFYFRFWERDFLPKKLVDYLKRKNIVEPTDHWRAFSMTGKAMEKMIKKAGLFCISQEYINWGTMPSHLIDCITVFARPDSMWQGKTERLENRDFMKEAHHLRRLGRLYGQKGGQGKG